MEVIVVFEGGDTDKPMILGSLYNGTHPPPFMLPGDKTRSGWRTQSSPGGNGNNELSFQDAATKEQIYVHAQRDLDEVVERNHTLQVRGDESVRVVGSRVDIVEGDVIARVAGNDEAQVAGDQTTQIDGDRVEVVTGSSDERVSGTLVTRVEGRERRCVEENADLEYGEDLTVRVEGCMTTLVGKADKKRSWVTHAEGTVMLSSLDSTEVISEGELILRVGKSSIRITEDKIELISSGITVKGAGAGISVDDAGMALSSSGDAQMIVEKKLTIMTKDGASLSMEKEFKIDGKKILLNSPEQATDPAPKEPEPPTTLALDDEEGNPLPYQRFLVVMDDGSEVGGMTDKDGKAEVGLASDGKVIFPDATLADEAAAQGDPRPYVVRQGDYLVKLGFLHGFDPEVVWNDAKNGDLKKLRGDHNILAPGDVVHLPAKSRKGSPVAKGTTNNYVAKVPKTTVHLRFNGDDGPLANEPYLIQGLGEQPTKKTDADGGISVEVPVHVREFQVFFTERYVIHTVEVGDMDPVDEPSGLRKRLQHLGYSHGWLPEDSSYHDSDESVTARDRQALMTFQTACGLTPTGALDEATKAELVKRHGS